MQKRIAWAACVVVLIGLFGAGAAFWYGGYRFYAVQTGSMMPTYSPGDMIVDAPAGGTYAEGQVITFASQGGGVSALTTHRIFGVADGVIETKGDANKTPDIATFHADEVVGSPIAAIPNAGYVFVFLRQPTGALSVMAGLFALTLLWRIFFPESETEPGVIDEAPRERIA